MNQKEICAHCGEFLPAEDGFYFEDQFFCPDCLEELTLLCHHCGERIWRGANCGTDRIPLCRSCYDTYYTHCDHCGRLLPQDDVYYDADDTLCWTCYETRQRERESIHAYYYKPTPIFYGDGPRFFGVELEMDEGGEDTDSAAEILAQANFAGPIHAYAKHDGSLNDGFEIVTHPMTLPYHLSEMPWKDVLRKAVSLGYRSHQSGTCGLHIHVSRNAFGSEAAVQEEAIARVLYFVEKHWEELLKFSRRTPRQLERWAARYGYREHPQEILDHAKKGYHGGRYTCVNLENRATIEFRMFRGTLKYNTLIATLQLVNRICDVALSLSDQEVKAISWTSFVAGCREPALIQYLKERRLYVNEPVTTEEEL